VALRDRLGPAAPLRRSFTMMADSAENGAFPAGSCQKKRLYRSEAC